MDLMHHRRNRHKNNHLIPPIRPHVNLTLLSDISDGTIAIGYKYHHQTRKYFPKRSELMNDILSERYLPRHRYYKSI